MAEVLSSLQSQDGADPDWVSSLPGWQQMATVQVTRTYIEDYGRGAWIGREPPASPSLLALARTLAVVRQEQLQGRDSQQLGDQELQLDEECEVSQSA